MSETPSSVRKLKVAELREKCQNLGLDTKGTKPILLNRIFSHLGFSEENQESTFLDESSTKINTEEILSKNELSADKINAKQPNSPVSRIDIHASDSDKQEVELDFVNEDLLDLNSPKIDSRRRQTSFEIWDEDEAAIKKSSSKIIIPVEVVKDYEVHYMDHVHLDPYVNDLHFQMEDDKFLSGSNITKSQLHNFWCGVLSTHGISEGKACFNCHYVSNITPDDTKQTEHGLRVGFSDPNAGLHLGSSKLSTGYDCSGNVYSNGKHVETFKKFAVGDSVTALIDITLTSVTYTFQINGVEAGKPIIADLSEIHVLFPHIFFKNVKFNVDFTCSFGQFSSFDSLKKLLTPGPKPPNSFPECELMMMVGIMAAGKSTWVKNFISSTNKQVYIIGRSLLFDRWRQIDQNSRQYLSERLVSSALSKLINLANKRMRNYIIDQTNYISSTRKKRLELFKQFGSRKAILVLPRLSTHALRIQTYKTAMSDLSSDDRHIHPDEIIEFKEKMTLPTLDEGFTEIIYVDCDETNAKEILDDYKYEALKFKEMKASLRSEKTVEQRPRIIPPLLERRPPRKISPRRMTSRVFPNRRAISPRRPIREPPQRRLSPRPRSPRYRSAGKTQYNRANPETRINKPHMNRTYNEYKPPLSRSYIEKNSNDNYRSNYGYNRSGDNPKNSGRTNMSFSDRRVNHNNQQSRNNAWDQMSNQNRSRTQARPYDGPPSTARYNQSYYNDKSPRPGYGGYSKTGSYPHY